MIARRLVAALLLGALGAACGSDAGPVARSGTRVVIDATGASVTIALDVRRIVTTVPGLTATVVALGCADRLVAVSALEKGDRTLVGVEYFPVFPVIPAETIASMRPDLVLVDPTLSPRDIAPLRARFPMTFACDSRSLDGLRTTFARLGSALGRGLEAKRLTDDLDAARAEARVEGSPLVLLLSWAEPPSVIALGPGSLLDDMLRSVGARNLAADLGHASGPVSSEAVVSGDPDWIVLTGATFSDDLRSRWSTVKAVKLGRIVEAGGDDFVQAGPRTAPALRRLAKLLTPGGGAIK